MLLSAAVGVCIPFFYIVPAGLLSAYAQNSTLSFWLDLPIEWPLFLYYYLNGPPPHPLAGYDIGILTFILGCDVLLYTLVAYLLLCLFSTLRRRKAAGV